MCWSETPKGVFQDSKAKDIGDKLIDTIQALTSVKSESEMSYENQKAIQDNLVESYPFKKSASAEEVDTKLIENIRNKFIAGHEEPTFQRNSEGLLWYTSENGQVSINLEVYFDDLIEETIQAMHDFANADKKQHAIGEDRSNKGDTTII
jgi:hypothetical protein